MTDKNTLAYQRGVNARVVNSDLGNLSKEQALFMVDVGLLINFIFESGWFVTGGELQRTNEQQAIYVREGKSKTPNSLHLSKRAIDLFFFRPLEGDSTKFELTWEKEHIQPFGDYWTSLSPKNTWGGNWRKFVDTPHFQRSP